jgi:hypothetical protein
MAKEKEKLSTNITRLGNRAVAKAIKENKEKGIPNVYSINGTLVYEMPDGTITTESPFDK